MENIWSAPLPPTDLALGKISKKTTYKITPAAMPAKFLKFYFLPAFKTLKYLENEIKIFCVANNLRQQNTLILIAIIFLINFSRFIPKRVPTAPANPNIRV